MMSVSPSQSYFERCLAFLEKNADQGIYHDFPDLQAHIYDIELGIDFLTCRNPIHREWIEANATTAIEQHKLAIWRILNCRESMQRIMFNFYEKTPCGQIFDEEAFYAEAKKLDHNPFALAFVAASNTRQMFPVSHQSMVTSCYRVRDLLKAAGVPDSRILSMHEEFSNLYNSKHPDVIRMETQNLLKGSQPARSIFGIAEDFVRYYRDFDIGTLKGHSRNNHPEKYINLDIISNLLIYRKDQTAIAERMMALQRLEGIYTAEKTAAAKSPDRDDCRNISRTIRLLLLEFLVIEREKQRVEQLVELQNSLSLLLSYQDPAATPEEKIAFLSRLQRQCTEGANPSPINTLSGWLNEELKALVDGREAL